MKSSSHYIQRLGRDLQSYTLNSNKIKQKDYDSIWELRKDDAYSSHRVFPLLASCVSQMRAVYLHQDDGQLNPWELGSTYFLMFQTTPHNGSMLGCPPVGLRINHFRHWDRHETKHTPFIWNKSPSPQGHRCLPQKMNPLMVDLHQIQAWLHVSFL